MKPSEVFKEMMTKAKVNFSGDAHFEEYKITFNYKEFMKEVEDEKMNKKKEEIREFPYTALAMAPKVKAFCPNCKKELASKSNYCPDCGQKLSWGNYRSITLSRSTYEKFAAMSHDLGKTPEEVARNIITRFAEGYEEYCHYEEQCYRQIMGEER